MRLAGGLSLMIAGLLTLPPAVGGSLEAQDQRQVSAGLRVNLYFGRPRQEPRTPLGWSAGELAKRRCTGTEHARRLYPDLAVLRQADPSALPPEQSRALAAAYISQDPEHARAVLAPLRASSVAATRYWGGLALLHIVVRSGGSLQEKDAEALLADVLGDAAEARLTGADAHLLRAIAATARGRRADALAALATAIRVEPTFFNAHALRLSLLLEELRQALPGTPAACRSAFSSLGAALHAVMQLEPCALQAAHLITYLRGQVPTPDQDAGLIVTEAYLATLVASRSTLSARHTAFARLPVTACTTEMNATLRELDVVMGKRQAQ